MGSAPGASASPEAMMSTFIGTAGDDLIIGEHGANGDDNIDIAKAGTTPSTPAGTTTTTTASSSMTPTWRASSPPAPTSSRSATT
jgi:hypothetical protein